MYHFQALKARFVEIEKRLSEDYSKIRAGRVSPQLLDAIRISAYGTTMPLNQVGNIALEDPQTLYISPWDKSHIPIIEKGIRDSDIGASPTGDNNGVRISFPLLTHERKTSLVRLVKEKLEHARISVRRERDEVWTDIQRQEQNGSVSEDEKYRYKDELQRYVDEANRNLEQIAQKKEHDVMGI